MDEEKVVASSESSNVSDKSRTVVFLLAFFLGELGIHRFYMVKIGTGILWLLTGGLFTIGWLVDWIVALAGGLKDQFGKPITKW